jgi:hypothetical protein
MPNDTALHPVDLLSQASAMLRALEMALQGLEDEQERDALVTLAMAIGEKLEAAAGRHSRLT